MHKTSLSQGVGRAIDFCPVCIRLIALHREFPQPLNRCFYDNTYGIQQMHQQGILKTDDLITRFFRLCTEMCVDLCYRALSEQSHSPTLVRAKCFHTLDAFVRLIALLVKHSGDNSNTVTKINLLNKVRNQFFVM